MSEQSLPVRHYVKRKVQFAWIFRRSNKNEARVSTCHSTFVFSLGETQVIT